MFTQVRTQQQLGAWRFGRLRKFVGKVKLTGGVETEGAGHLNFSRHSLLPENLGKRLRSAQLGLRELEIDRKSQSLLLLFSSDVDLLLQQFDASLRNNPRDSQPRQW